MMPESQSDPAHRRVPPDGPDSVGLIRVNGTGPPYWTAVLLRYSLNDQVSLTVVRFSRVIGAAPQEAG